MYTNGCALSCGSGYTCFSPGSGHTCSNPSPASYSCYYSSACRPSCCSRYRTSCPRYCDPGRVTSSFRYGQDKCGYSPSACIRGSGGSRADSGSVACGYKVCSVCGGSLTSSRYTSSCGHRSSCKSHCGSGSNGSPRSTPSRAAGYSTSSLSRIVLNRVTPREMRAFWGEESTKRNATIGCGSCNDSRGGSCSLGSCSCTLLTRPVGESCSSETRPRGIGGRDSTLSSERTSARSACQVTRGSGGSHQTDYRTGHRSDQRSDQTNDQQTDQPSARSGCSTGTRRRL